MKLSTKGRYAVESMVDIAKYYERQEYISLHSISVRNNISLSYLEQLFLKLKRANLVVSLKGSKGGYTLARKPKDISILEIIESVDEKSNLLLCRPDGKSLCQDGNMCNSHRIWYELKHHIQAYLSSRKLSDFINKEGENN